MRDFTGVPGAAGGFADNDTRWTPEVANALVQEVANVVTNPAGGDTALNPGDNGQLLAAIGAIVGRALDATYDTGGYETSIALGPIIIKVGLFTGSYAEQTMFVPFEVGFPNQCFGAFPVAYNPTLNLNHDTYAMVGTVDATGFYLAINFIGGSGTQFNEGVRYFAIGR